MDYIQEEFRRQREALAGLLLALAACRNDRQADAHPDWSYGAVVYEMNVRQYTP